MNIVSRWPLLLIFLLPLSVSTQASQSFPGYLNEQYCNDTKREFITSSVKSLRKYRETQLSKRHRGGMYNINNFLVQRKSWLLECKQYLEHNGSDPLFENRELTEQVFSAIDSVSNELKALISGVSYSVDPGEDPSAIAAEKFDQLFKLIEHHKTKLQLKGHDIY